MAIPCKGKGNSFKVTAKIPGPEGNRSSVSIKSNGEDTFTLSVGGETKTGLSMKKGENYIGDADFRARRRSGAVGSALPDEGSLPWPAADASP